MQSCVAAANRAVLATCVTILAHMAMNRGGRGGMQNRTGAKMTVGSRHGMAKVVAGKAWRNKAVAGKQLANEVAGTGLAVNSWQTIRPAQALQ